MLKELCKEDGVMSTDFMAAVNAGGEIQVNSETVVGWITLDRDEVEFRNSLEYRVKTK